MNGSFQCLKLAGRPGRDAKWKGGTGLKAEMGNEGSSSSSSAAGRATAAAAAAGANNQPKTD